MSETEWMYDSLTERFGENLGERQRVVDALLIAKALVGSNVLGNSNHEGITSIARFILDEWGKCEDLYKVPEFKGDLIRYCDWLDITAGVFSPPPGVWFTNLAQQEVTVKNSSLEGLDGIAFEPGPLAFPLKRKEN